MNRLFVTYKPSGVSSNSFLSSIKRRYGVKKAGFSGTLDPFAKGVLIVAFGQFTKLFRFLNKSPKRYRATLWIGAYSPTLDVEKIEEVLELKPFVPSTIELIANSLNGEIEYLPPKYCAKRVDGKRAYNLARDGEEFELKKIESTIYDFKVISYMHPFLTFEISISEGGYIRSIGEIISSRLGFKGCLSSLERLSEGEFIYENEKALNPLDFIDLKENAYLGDYEDIKLGKKLNLEQFEIKENGLYKIVQSDKFSIVSIDGSSVEYILNRISLC